MFTILQLTEIIGVPRNRIGPWLDHLAWCQTDPRQKKFEPYEVVAIAVHAYLVLTFAADSKEWAEWSASIYSHCAGKCLSDFTEKSWWCLQDGSVAVSDPARIGTRIVTRKIPIFQIAENIKQSIESPSGRRERYSVMSYYRFSYKRAIPERTPHPDTPERDRGWSKMMDIFYQERIEFEERRQRALSKAGLRLN